MAPCFCNLNRCTRAIGKTSMVPKPGKFTTAWLPEHKANLVPLGKTCGYLQLRRFTFSHYTISIYDQCRIWHLVTKLSQKCIYFLGSCLCCRDLCSNRLNNKCDFEKQYWHLAFPTATNAPVRLARLGWFPSQANLPLHGGWRRTPKTCHWPWNVESTIRKAELLKNTTQNLIAIGKTGGYLQLHSFTFLHSTISI